jgi:hypothetical protein
LPASPATRTALAALASLALIGGVAVATPGVAARTAPLSAAHPYSDPVWYPLQADVILDCVKANPGCTTPHNFWGMDVLPTGQSSRGPVTSTATVNAMGAGIAHIGNAQGDPCPASTTSFGTWVWVDHGGGVISRYGHFSSIRITEGELVGPGTPLGVVGVSGKGGNCWNAYTDFMLREKGVSGPSFEFPTLKACDSGTVVSRPAALPGSYARWNDVPKGTVIPGSGDACRSTVVPATPNRPGSVKLAAAGKGRIKATWARPAAGVDKVRVEFGEFHPSKGTWDYQQNERWYDLSASASSVSLKSLIKKHKWRVRVHFHNAAGWSAASAWVTRTVK